MQKPSVTENLLINHLVLHLESRIVLERVLISPFSSVRVYPVAGEKS